MNVSGETTRLSYTAVRGSNTTLREEAVEAILKSMREDDGRLRCIAIKALGEMKAEGAVEELAQYLRDPDPDVRCDAATALGLIGDRKAVAPLTEALNDKEGPVRICAVQSLGILRDPAAVLPLIDIIRFGEDFFYDFGGDMSGNYRWEIEERAVKSLGQIGDNRVAGPMLEMLKREDSEFMMGPLLQSLFMIGDKTVYSGISSYLKNPDPVVRRAAAGAFAYAKDREAVNFLTDALVDEDSVVKIRAIEAIGKVGKEGDLIPVILLLKDGDREVRLAALEVTGKIGGESSIRHILPLLKDPDKEVRRKAVEVLGKIASPESVEPLLKILGNPDENEAVYREAVMSLIKIGDQRAAGALINLARDRRRDKTVRIKALFGIGRIKSVEGLEAVIDIIMEKKEDHDIRRAALQSLPLFDEKSVLGAISADLADLDADELSRIGVSRALKGFKSVESEAILVSLLINDACEAVRIESAISLAYRGNDAGFGIIVRVVKDGKAGDYPDIFDAVKNIKDKKAVELLLDAVNSSDTSIRCAAIRSLGNMGDKDAVLLLISLLNNDAADVRREAVITLGALADKRAVASLLTSLFNPEMFHNFRNELIRSLAVIDVKEATETLLDVLGDEKKREQHWIAIEALSAIHSMTEGVPL